MADFTIQQSGKNSKSYPQCPQWVNNTWVAAAPQDLHVPNVFELSSKNGSVVSAAFVAIQGDSNWVGVVVIDAAADRREQILLPRRGGVDDDGGER